MELKLEEMRRFAVALAGVATPGDCIALSGDLGAGKTSFAQAFIASLLKTPEPVTSPTFTLIQHYESGKGFRILHADLYRLKSAEELTELGLEEAFDTHVSLIEWPEMASAYLPPHALHVVLEHIGEDSRKLTLYSAADTWKQRIRQLA